MILISFDDIVLNMPIAILCIITICIPVVWAIANYCNCVCANKIFVFVFVFISFDFVQRNLYDFYV